MNWIRERMGWTKLGSDEADWENAEVHVGHPVKMLYRTTLTAYSLRIMAPAEEWEHVHQETEQDKRVLADMPAMLEQIEEELEARLPEGYQVRITEWNR